MGHGQCVAVCQTSALGSSMSNQRGMTIQIHSCHELRVTFCLSYTCCHVDFVEVFRILYDQLAGVYAHYGTYAAGQRL